MNTKSDRELFDFVLSHPIGGGEDPPAGGGEGAEGKPPGGDKGQPASPAGGEGGKAEPATLIADEGGVFKDNEGNIFIPKTRLDEETAKAEKLQADLEALDTLPPEKPPKVADLSEAEQEMKADLVKLFPALEHVGNFMTQMAIDRESAAEVFVSNVETKCESFLEEVGIKPTAENRVDLENLIGGRMDTDRGLKRRYLAGDIKVVDEIWPKVRESFYKGGEKRRDDLVAADKKKRLPRSIQQGAPQGGKVVEEKPPETTAEANKLLRETHDKAWDRLNSQRQ